MLQNYFLYVVLLVWGFVSCTSSSEKTIENNSSSPQIRSVQPQSTAQFNVVEPLSDTTLQLGDSLEIFLSYEDQFPIALKTSIDGQSVSMDANEDFSILTIPTSQGVIGENTLEIEVMRSDSSKSRIYYTFHLLSDLTPVRQSYTVVDEFPHNDESFTQGLIYRSGTVCEGSGLQGKSVITCFEPRTGKVVQQAFMPPEYFGEGISQLPVCRGSEVLGIVTEKDLLRPAFEGKVSADESVTLVLNDNFEIFDTHEMLEKVTNALIHKKTTLITDKGKIVGILTDIDILNYIADQGRS